MFPHRPGAEVLRDQRSLRRGHDSLDSSRHERPSGAGSDGARGTTSASGAPPGCINAAILAGSVSMSPSRDEYDRLEAVARQYDSQHDFDRQFSEFGAQLILEEFQGERLLEVGCASGVMTRRFAGQVLELHVVEGSQTYLSALQSELGEKVQCHCCLAEDFAPDTLFDGIVLASLLEHVESPVQLLRQVRTWLKPNGVLFVIVPNAESIHRQAGVVMGLLPTTKSFTERDVLLGHRRVYDETLLCQHLEQAGFSIQNRQGIMIKVMSNSQMALWPEATVEALLEVGRRFPQIAALIYVSCHPISEPRI